jgi:hypothetical protein
MGDVGLERAAPLVCPQFRPSLENCCGKRNGRPDGNALMLHYRYAPKGVKP